MRLHDVLAAVDVQASRRDWAAVDVTSVTHDSNGVAPGTLFCCVRGTTRDGHDFAATAVERGAVAVLGERLVDVDVPQVVVAATRPAMAEAAAALHDHPSRSLTVVGVTGTNGKTTTTYLLESIFTAANRKCAVIGSMSGARTTPEAPQLQEQLARYRDNGYAAVAMEVSSAALVAHRVDGMRFAAGVFTNLGRDHLGEVHETMDEYFEAKTRLFHPALTSVGVVNADDPWGQRLLDAAPIPMVPFSIDDAQDRSGASFTWRGQSVALRLPGTFNVMNALAAATTAAELGIDATDIAKGLGALASIPGHFEWVDIEAAYKVAVDYAHTPEALEQVLHAARNLTHNRLIVVFGCGGDRDRGKRAPMGAAAATLADVAVLTSDNPRHEDPEAIIAEVAAGTQGRGHVVIEPDRARAIALALETAEPGDLVLIAGKGHETGQQIGDEVLPFDDRDVARQMIETLR